METAAGVIDQICSKIGVASEYLIPRISAMKFYSNVFGAVMCGIMFIACVVTAIIAHRCAYRKKDPYYEDEQENLICLTRAAGLGAIIPFIFLIWNIYSAFMWKLAPEAETIEYILKEMRS